MSESIPSGSPSESAGESHDAGSTNASESSVSSGSSGSGGGSAAAASQVVNAMENATKTSDGNFEITVDGETISLSLEELKAGYQKAKSSAKRFQEAAEERKLAAKEKKEAEEFRGRLMKNPLQALLEAGVDGNAVRKHYESAVWEWLQHDNMTPEQKTALKQKHEQETEKQKLAREREEIENWKKERERENLDRETQKHQDSYAKQINEALTKHGLPQTPEVVAKMAGYMSQALEDDYELSVDEAAAMYKEESDNGLKSLLKGYSQDQLRALLGEEGLKAIRAKDLEQIKNPTPARKQSAPPAPKPVNQRPGAKDFFKNLK